ncbi:MAG: ATP-binding protein [Anaerofustis sp.]
MQSISDAKQQYEQICAAYKAAQMRKRDQILAQLPQIVTLQNEINQLWVLRIGEKISEAECERSISEKRDQIALTLKENHYLPSDLELSPMCPLCKDKGYHDGVMCNCLKQTVIDLCYAQSNIRAVLQSENFDTFDDGLFSEKKIDGLSPRAQIRGIRNECTAYLSNFDSNTQHLLFMGGVGTGKTFVSHCIAKELLDRGKNVVYFTSYDLIEKFTDISLGKADRQLSELIWDSDLIIVDDLGSERMTDFAQNVLFHLLNERLVRNKPMLISTNLSVGELKETYNNRIFSRIIGNFKGISFVGDDIRLRKRLGKTQ